MQGKRIAVTISAVALILAGCAATPVQTEPGKVTIDNLCLTSATEGSSQSGGGFGGGDWFKGLPPEAGLVLLAIIGGVVLADYSLCHLEDQVSSPEHAVTVSAGIYRAGDGLFAVALPRLGSEDMTIVQRYDHNHDYVLFGSSGSQMGYTVSASHEALAATLDDFVALSTAHDRTSEGGASLGRAGFKLKQRQEITLDGQPAVFEVYYLDMSQADDATRRRFPGVGHMYYLSYFMLSGEHGAAIYIAWPGACASCDAGSESAIRTIDPRIQKFLESFRLPATGSVE